MPITDFTIGADPEFALSKVDGSLVSAGDVLTDPDNPNKFGKDGNGITFEIRPKESKNPLQVVNNIRKIFLTQIKEEPKFMEYKWHSGSYFKDCPLGGHIHFGLNNRQIDFTNACNTLSNYVGAASILIEKKAEGIGRRNRGNYGGMTDHRAQNWGFEWRTLSSWLSSPYIAAGILCLSKTVINEMVNNPSFRSGDYVNNDDFCLMRSDTVRSKWPTIWAEIEKMALYPTFKSHIDVIKTLIDNNLSWSPKSDLKDSWGIASTYKPIPVKMVSIEGIWKNLSF